jgi:hypothetical protein
MHARSDEGGGLHGRPNRRGRGAAGARPVRGRGRDRGRVLRDLRHGPAQRHGGMGPAGCDPRARVLGPDRGGWTGCRRVGGGGRGHRGARPRLRDLRVLRRRPAVSLPRVHGPSARRRVAGSVRRVRAREREPVASHPARPRAACGRTGRAARGRAPRDHAQPVRTPAGGARDGRRPARLSPRRRAEGDGRRPRDRERAVPGPARCRVRRGRRPRGGSPGVRPAGVTAPRSRRRRRRRLRVLRQPGGRTAARPPCASRGSRPRGAARDVRAPRGRARS